MNDHGRKSPSETMIAAAKEKTFECHVRSRSAPNGSVTVVHLRAASPEEVIQQLLKQGFIVVSVKIVTGMGDYLRSAFGLDTPGGLRAFSFMNRVSSAELIFFGTQLATLVKAGIPLLRSLEIIWKGNANPAFREALEKLRKRISEGSSFTGALRESPDIFPWIWANLVEVGETTGKLPECLTEIVHYQESANRIKGKVVTALFYPGILAVAVTAALTFLMVFIVPKFAEIFREQKMTLPAITKVVIAMSAVMRSQFPLVVAGVVAGVIAIFQLKKTPQFRASLDLFALNVPIFGELSLKVAVVRFSRALGTLLCSGVPILQALEISGKLVDNKYLENQIGIVAKAVKGGQGLGVQLEQRKVFPVFMTQLLSTGEESGQLENFLNLIATYYEESVDTFLSRLAVLLEPVMLIFMGSVIGVIVISMFLPIVQMSTSVGQA